MKTQQITFKFKGDRDYIHGTDMFNHMSTLHGDNVEKQIFTVHEFVRSPVCRLCISEDRNEIEHQQNIKVRYNFFDSGKQFFCCLTEVACDDVVTERYEYDESLVGACSITDHETIRLTEKSPYSFIETVVALNKIMHERLFPETSGKWAFTRIDLKSPCEARDKISLKLRHNMNMKLTKTEILFNGAVVGSIYFSLVNK